MSRRDRFELAMFLLVCTEVLVMLIGVAMGWWRPRT